MNNPALATTDIRIIDEVDIDPAVDAGIVKLITVCFPHWKDKYGKGRTWRGNEPLFSVIRQCETEVCAHVAVIERTLTIGAMTVRTAGIANVGVLPDYRGKRLVDGVLRAAVAEAEKRDFDIAMLFTHAPTDKVYERNGWITIGERQFIRTEDGLDAEMPEGSIKMFHPLKIKRFPPGTVDLRGDKW